MKPFPAIEAMSLQLQAGKKICSFLALEKQSKAMGAVPAMRPNPSIERTCPGKPGQASHLQR